MEQKSHQASKNTTGNPNKYDPKYAYYSHMGEDGKVVYDYPIVAIEDQTPEGEEFLIPRFLVNYFGGKEFFAFFVGCTDRKVADDNLRYLDKYLRYEKEYKDFDGPLNHSFFKDPNSEDNASPKEELMEAFLEGRTLFARDPAEDFRLAESLELRDRIADFIAGKFDDQGRHSKIFRLFTTGYSLGEIAKKMGMTYCTVRNYQIANWEAAKEYREKFC